jgi:hypothetical protein
LDFEKEENRFPFSLGLFFAFQVHSSKLLTSLGKANNDNGEEKV